MKDLLIKNKSHLILVDSQIENEKTFLESDLNQLVEKKLLVYRNRTELKVNFVGEFITPNNIYVSLPKNFLISEENVELIQKVLLKFKNLKDRSQLLISNYSFVPETGSDIKSEIFYFNELKKYFLDFISYKFIYPSKKSLKFSKSPIKNSRVDIIRSSRESDIKGYGMMYKVNDVNNDKEWNLDDIYYTTLKKLSTIYGSERDISEIKDMKDYLESEGYNINEDGRILQENIETEKIINDIKKCQVGIIHNPIKSTLLDYYEGLGIRNKYTIFAFYTSNFNLVWEFFSKKVLKDNEEFKKIVLDDIVGTTSFKEEISKESSDLRPDIFSQFNGKRFIGDSKYYSRFDDNFYKEWIIYNDATENIYPMVVFVPGLSTDPKDRKVAPNGINELIIIQLSLEDVIKDVMNNTDNIIDEVQNIISSRGRFGSMREMEYQDYDDFDNDDDDFDNDDDDDDDYEIDEEFGGEEDDDWKYDNQRDEEAEREMDEFHRKNVAPKIEESN